MAKKTGKPAPKIPLKSAPAAPQPPPNVVKSNVGPAVSERSAGDVSAIDQPLRFSRRVYGTLGVFTAVFVLFVLLKWHYVSLPVWNTILPDGAPADRGLVAGTPRQVRMDDYAVGAPWTLSNALRGFPQENEALGGLKTPLLVSPAKHAVMLFRPAYWGFLFLDIERGYAWMYDLSPLVLLAGALLFFLVVTSGQYWLSLAGALILLLSSGTVWWSFIPSSMIGYACLGFVALVGLVRARTPLSIIGWGALTVWAAVTFVLILYPPYQVPLVYLFGLLLVGYFLNERAMLLQLRLWPIKLGALAGATLLAGLVLASYFADARETLTAVTSTAYPGQRSELGGSGFVANAFSEFYSWSFSDTNFPQAWLNICELSHYVNFAPLLLPLLLLLFREEKRVNWLLAGAGLFVVAIWYWIAVGLPKPLAGATLLGMVPPRRAQIPLGVGNVILLITYLGAVKNATASADRFRPAPFAVKAGLVAFVIAFVAYTAYVNIADAGGFLKPFQMVVPVLYFSMLGCLLLFPIRIPNRELWFSAGLLLFLLPNLKANPLAKGLTPLTDNAFYKAVRQLVEQEPDARWMVNGNQFVTYIVTATGAKQITGVKYIPNRPLLRILDPKMQRDSVYNRYAHVTFQSYVDGRDSVVLVNQFQDAYVIAMDPCSPRMKAMNVRYVVFDHPTQPVETRCMQPVVQMGSLTVYRLNP